MLLAHHTNTALQNCALCHILLACIVSQRQPHQSRSTGHGNAWTRPDSTRADEAPAPKRRQTERDTETAPTAEPPRDQAQKRTRQKNQSQHGSSSGDKTASRQPAPPEPQRSSQSQKSQKRGTVDHERRRAETERRRAEKERERRENDSKTPLFSPSHRTPSRSTARASPAPADMNGSRNAAFFGSAFVEYAELTEINAYFAICIGGWVYIFTPSATPKIWLCTLFSMPLSFSPNHHLTNTPFINDIFPYKYKYPLLQSSLRKNALINADSSSSWQQAKIHFHNFMLQNTP